MQKKKKVEQNQCTYASVWQFDNAQKETKEKFIHMFSKILLFKTTNRTYARRWFSLVTMQYIVMEYLRINMLTHVYSCLKSELCEKKVVLVALLFSSQSLALCVCLAEDKGKKVLKY